MFKESLGGHEQSTAYCLIYIDRATREQKANSTTLNYDLSKGAQEGHDLYNSLVVGALRQEVVDDNSTFAMEVQDAKITTISRKVCDEYDRCYMSLDNLSKKDDKDNLDPTLINSVFYLYNTAPKKDSPKMIDLAKWKLLDNIVRAEYELSLD